MNRSSCSRSRSSPSSGPRSRARLLAAVVGPALLLLGCFGTPPTTGALTDSACQLDSKNEQTPGYPFDVERFGGEVLPVLARSCGASGCHGEPTGAGGLTIWSAAKPGDCEFGKTFNSVVAKVDLATPANSRLTAVVSGGSTSHPFTFPAAAPELASLRKFVEAAARTYADGGGGVTPPPGPSPYDYKVYQAQIQPMLERCTSAGCHGSGAGGFTLKPTPAPDGADMQANFIAVTSRGDLTSPDRSVIYVRSTVRHAGGASTVVDETQAKQLLAWIEDAKQHAGSNPSPTCAPIDKFNAGVFASEVLPILAGQLDLNAPDGQARGAGCMSGVCHGIDRGPGTLSLPPGATAAAQLQSFLCFSNLASPSASEVLTCPLNNPGCRRYPHPGQDVLGGSNDLNYQRLLAFLYGGRADVSPMDFAYFVRRINPIFNDVNAVEGGAQGRSCADTASCHGVGVAGQVAPNGSDFAIIPAASDLDRLTFNFVSATGFANFLSPQESSLFLYPTDEISNRAAHPFATGLPHPGGLDFAADSVEARAILQWAGGLRPDAAGFQHNWLVVGDFPASQIVDPTLIDEAGVVPAIFDRGGGAFNRGEWDGLFADTRDVDLNTVFPRTATSGRVAYAVSYAINTVPRQLRVQLGVATNNPVRIFINGALVAQNDGSGGTTAFMTLPAAGAPEARPTRIMIKILQRATDARLAFTAQLRDELGALLTDGTRELVFTLGPNGGI